MAPFTTGPFFRFPLPVLKGPTQLPLARPFAQLFPQFFSPPSLSLSLPFTSLYLPSLSPALSIPYSYGTLFPFNPPSFLLHEVAPSLHYLYFLPLPPFPMPHSAPLQQSLAVAIHHVIQSIHPVWPCAHHQSLGPRILTS